MLIICRVNVLFQDAPAELHHISLIYISIFNRPQFEENWLRKLRTIAFIPVYFVILNVYYNIQLSIVHISEYCLMPATVYQ